MAALHVLFWGLTLRRGEQETLEHFGSGWGIIVGLGFPVGRCGLEGCRIGSTVCEGAAVRGRHGGGIQMNYALVDSWK